MIKFWILSEKCHVEWGRVGLLQLQVAAVDILRRRLRHRGGKLCRSRQRKRLCVMTPNSSTSSLWQYVNDTMEQYGTLDLTGKPAVMAGVGLVLDTRSNDAKAVVKRIEREMAEIQGKADKACGEVRKQAESCVWTMGCLGTFPFTHPVG